jgi:hypothetical protein
MSRHQTTRVVRTKGTPMIDAEHRRQRALVEASLLRGIKTTGRRPSIHTASVCSRSSARAKVEPATLLTSPSPGQQSLRVAMIR